LILFEENNRYEAGPARHTIPAPFYKKKRKNVYEKKRKRRKIKKGEEN
jgi:hypothetical protein